MKILAAQRLRSTQLFANDTTPVSEVAKDIESYVRTLFPKSFILVKSSTKLKPTLDIYFTLGKGKEDYKGGYSHNDVARISLSVYDVVTKDGTDLLSDAPYKVEKGLSYIIPSSSPHLAYDTVKVTRAFTAKNLPAFVKKIKADFKKLAVSMKSNIEEVSEVMGKDMSSYIR